MAPIGALLCHKDTKKTRMEKKKKMMGPLQPFQTEEKCVEEFELTVFVLDCRCKIENHGERRKKKIDPQVLNLVLEDFLF